MISSYPYVACMCSYILLKWPHSQNMSGGLNFEELKIVMSLCATNLSEKLTESVVNAMVLECDEDGSGEMDLQAPSAYTN
jgi:hypothetical protein